MISNEANSRLKIAFAFGKTLALCRRILIFRLNQIKNGGARGLMRREMPFNLLKGFIFLETFARLVGGRAFCAKPKLSVQL
ncbi:MAG: hypothetical protein ABWZ66_06710 [Pyrinomonadaceae bacterium]